MGRSKIGTRANTLMPTVRGRSVSMIASMGVSGMHYHKIISNSTVNGNIFSCYIEDLCYYLKNEKYMNDVCLILDNARIHRENDIVRITSSYNYSFHFLSPYSYMLNPIECAFSKIKSIVRGSLRMENDMVLSESIAIAAGQITHEDSSGFFRLMSRNITNAAAGLPYNHV